MTTTNNNAVILQELHRIEEQHNVKIVYALESGSRAWGFSSLDSDYDVRFIYVRPLKDYLSISERKDTIALPINTELDINGWDIKKVLRNLKKSNAALFEWLQSPVVYKNDNGFLPELRKLADSYYSRSAVLHHYRGLFKKFSGDLTEHEPVKIKRIFYILRPLLAAAWVVMHTSIPPMEFGKLLVLADAYPEAQAAVQRLLAEKAQATESTQVKVEPILFLFIREFAEKCKVQEKSLTSGHDYPEQPLNDFFRNIIK